jgi:hypothetical protein
MAVTVIDMGKNLTSAARKVIENRFASSSDFFAIPIKFVDNRILIGFGPETETDGLWAGLPQEFADKAWYD